jgi:hypothetical protein
VRRTYKYMTRIFPVLLILFCLFRFGCGNGKDIYARVVDTAGNPVDGATIKLVVWDYKKDAVPTKTIETVTTDKNGKFEIEVGEEKPETKLVLSIEKEGFKAVTLMFTPLLIQKNDAVFKDYQVILEKK